MRKVSVRQLRANLKHELASLPFTITLRGKKIANVYTIDSKTDDVYTKPTKSVNTSTKRVYSKLMGKYVDIPA